MIGHVVILRGAHSRAEACRVINAAPAGSVMDLRPPTRTTDQNAKMWAMLSDVSRAMPGGRRHTPDTWKALFMRACGHAVQFEAGLDGHPFPVGFRSSKLSKAQMSDLIEFIYAWGSENNVRWSDAE